MKRRKRKRRRRRSSRTVRIIVLVLLLLAGVFTSSWYMLQQTQRAMAKHDLEAAESWLQWSAWVPIRRGHQAFLRARLARRRADFYAMKRHLERAGELGYEVRLLEREKQLAMAQQGDVQILTTRFGPILKEADSDVLEVFEAFVIGLLHMRRYDGASELLVGWCENYPDDPFPRYLLGSVYQDQDRDQEAEALFREVLRLDPEHHQAAYSLGIVLIDQQKTAAAVELLIFAANKPELRADADLARSQCYRTLGRTKAAEQLLLSLVKETGDSAATVELAQIKLEAAEFQTVADLLEPVVEDHPELVNARYAYAQALRQLGDEETADHHFSLVIETNRQLAHANELAETLGSGPDSADQHLRVARIHLQYGSRAEGLQWLLRSYSVNKQHRPTVEELVLYYQQQSQRYPDVPDYQRTLDNFKNLLVQLGG
jgi:tetratricopeptide (TPR) repeat protein